MRFKKLRLLRNEEQIQRRKLEQFRELPDKTKINKMRYEFSRFVEVLYYIVLGWSVIGFIYIIFSMNSKTSALFEIGTNNLTYLLIYHTLFILSIIYNLYCSLNSLKNNFWFFKLIFFVTGIFGFISVSIIIAVIFIITAEGNYKDDSEFLFVILFILLPNVFEVIIKTFTDNRVEFKE